ncbi:conserved Plasmodium protein, unknown function [Plasmodium ovale curtisi]|uniref:Nudix hydrolase domain-containing protein n=1 Tax=Plasmodium ovale curtisi TaxID=864141 RepID=A0A1A8WT29_PLAOA|nr:conserved Plasmodium protein, unknown function [Plasmodium ovale curtisi]
MHRKNGTTNLKVRASTYSRAKSRASGTFDSSNLLQYRLLYITFGVKAEEVKRRGGEGKSKQNQKGKYTTEITQREAHIEKDPKRKTVHPLCSLKPKMKDIINYTFEDNKDELVIIVNEENEFQGLETRKVMRTSNLWHRSTSVFVFTKINEEYFIYVHKRSNIKDYCPSYYSIGFGGVVSEKETFIGNAVKELQEESGITKKPEQLFELGVTFVDPAFETTPQPNEVEFITKIPLNEFDSFLQREQLTVISNHKRTKNLAFLLTKINFQMINKEKIYLFKYWTYSLQDLVNNSESRAIRIWLVCINLIDYIDILSFNDLFNHENVKNAMERISPYFQQNNDPSLFDKEAVIDPLLAFLKNTKHTSKIRDCDKVVVLSSNIHIWRDRMSDLKLIGDEFHETSCEFYFFNVYTRMINVGQKMKQLKCDLGAYPNFFFKSIEINKINILQISKEILAIKFVASFTLCLKNELLLKCEARPLITELESAAYTGLNEFSVQFDIRAKALKEGISQHLIYGIPIFLSAKLSYEQNLFSLSSLSKELLEKTSRFTSLNTSPPQNALSISDIWKSNFRNSEKEVRFLWVGTPMVKGDMAVALNTYHVCAHTFRASTKGLSTQEIYSITTEEYDAEHIRKNESIENAKITAMKGSRTPLNFPEIRVSTLSEEGPSLGEALYISSLSVRNKLASLRNIAHEDKPIPMREETQLVKKKDENNRKNYNLKKKKEIADPRSLLLANMNKAFQKNII